MSIDRALVLVLSPRAKPRRGEHLPSYQCSLSHRFAFCVACRQVIVSSQLGLESGRGQELKTSQLVHEPPR
jgi:hypothetical protein